MGARDRVELKHVENVFAVVVPAMHVDSRTGENARVDLSTNGGGRSFKKRFGVALADAIAYADARVAHDEANDAVTLRDAWSRARALRLDATDGRKQANEELLNEPVPARVLASSAFAFAFDDADPDPAKRATNASNISNVSSLAREFAAHALLSSRAGARFFQPSSKGRFAARAPQDVAAVESRAEEQDAADAARAAKWQRVRDAVSLPPGSKPDARAFVEATRGSGDAADAWVARTLESLEAYALGAGRYTAGQAACAKDALGRLGMRVSERSARDALAAVGRWRGLEDASWRRWGVETNHDASLEAYAAALADGSIDAPADADAATRKDLTRLTTYAIDAADSEEIDDAVSAERTKDGKTRVWIHVADASRWSPILEDSIGDETDDDSRRVGSLRVAMDAAARRRGASAYGPEGAIPMFPEAFAFKRGPVSLALGETRCAMSVTAVLDDSGEAEEFWIGPTTIRVTHAVTETEAARMLDEHESKKDGGEHAGLASLLEAATRRASLRERRGAVTIELPESACVVRRSDSAANESSPEEEGDEEDDDEDDAAEEDDENDLVERDAHVLASGGRNAGERAAAAARRHEAARLDVSLRVAAKAPRAHVVVSEMMILAGELVGRFGAANDLPLPYRGQGDPVSVDVSGAPEGVPRAVLKRGGMRGASVGATPRRHGGLGVEAYVQFTSPIRRYLDVLAHAQIKAFLRTEKNGSSTKALSGRVPFPDAAALEPVLQTVNERTRDAKSATRDATAFWQTFWFATRGRDVEHDAIVAKWIRRHQRLAAVFLSATGVERSVKLDAVEKALGTRVSLGDLVVLRVRDADPFENRLAFDATRVVKK